MEPASDRYYRPSGAVPVMGTLTMLFGGMAAAVIFGLIAAVVNRWLPYVMVLLVVTIGYGAAVGGAVRFSARIAHVRHPGFTLFVAFAIGLFAVYIAWVWYMWVWNVKEFSPLKNALLFLSILSQPGKIFGTMQAIAANGGWSLFGWTPKGGMLYAIWTLEALMYIFFAMAVAVNANLTYCEDCRRWTVKKDKVAHLPLTDVEMLKRTLEEERYEVLDELRSQRCNDNDRLDISTSLCPSCTATSFLTVSRVRVATDGNGNPTENSQPIVQHLIVPREVAERLAIPVIPQRLSSSAVPPVKGSQANPASVE